MANAQEIILVGGIVKALNDIKSWCGETHIQKSSYVAKVVEHIPFESEFILYKHGPFSFDLNAVLNNMRSQNIVTVSRLGMGSSFVLNEGLWNALDKASGNIFARYEDHVRKVCAYLGRKNVAELERVATAIYVRLNFPELDELESRSKLIELKPHITPPQAALAFQESLDLLAA